MFPTNARIRQLQYQSETWQRDLAFIRQENIVLKNHLAEMLSQYPVTPPFLERIEVYQTHFVTKDEILLLILSEIKEWDKSLVTESLRSGEGINEELIEDQKRLSDAVHIFISEFSRLKSDFNNYVCETI